jgi:hypothetical protein
MNLKKKIAGFLTLTTFVSLLAGSSMAGAPKSSPATVSDYAAGGAQIELSSGGTVNFTPVFLAGVVVGLMAAEAAEDAQASGCAIKCGTIGSASEKLLDL